MARTNPYYYDEAEIEADTLREYYQPLLDSAEAFIREKLGDTFDGFVPAYGCYKHGSFEFYWEHPDTGRTIVCSGVDNDAGTIDTAGSDCYLEEDEES